ncbi:sororin [Etheostoma cragini]|uniref:sororin n=1 Tax=Etheostoma cragini TaxID=417921 RepID=UPI00155E2F51|nr:sororin [Etheostoma cragini]
MNEGTLQNIMAESNNLNGSQRRRSPRLTSPPQANVKTGNNMALASVAVKRSITVRKIAPRKTVAPSEHNKENTSRRSGLESSQKKKSNVSTPDPLEADDCGSTFAKPDPNIPGVALVKEKRRRKRVQQIGTTELDALAAQMNAEFEEAEEFELIVE